MRRPFIVEVQESSRAIADLQESFADILPRWFIRLTGADETLREWARQRRQWADKVEMAWWAHERGEFEPWDRLFP